MKMESTVKVSRMKIAKLNQALKKIRKQKAGEKSQKAKQRQIKKKIKEMTLDCVKGSDNANENYCVSIL